jgi:hypothetical protein
LFETPNHYGVEIDLRAIGQTLCLAHDAFNEGELFENWLKNYNHSIIVANVKEEGIEDKFISILEQTNVKTKYFFLDQPYPTLRKSYLKGYQVSERISELENLSTAFVQSKQTIWIDSFHGNWKEIELKIETQLDTTQTLKMCFVSPELQGRDNSIEYLELSKLLKKYEIKNETYICTKFPERWLELLA